MGSSPNAIRCCAALVAGLWCGQLVAAAISVSPTRIELSARHPVATLEVRNDGADPVTMQLERMVWRQQDGVDVYAGDTSLIAAPSVFDLPPHGRQVLRIAVRAGMPASGERAFRLYASEVPVERVLPGVASQSGAGLQLALRIGVPIFVEPSDGSARLNASMAYREGGPAVRLRNDGEHYTRALGIEVRDASGQLIWQTREVSYLLANGEHRWPVDVATAARLSGEHLRYLVTTEAAGNTTVSQTLE